MIEAFVTAADDVTGPFDMILRTEARDPEEVGTKILPRLVRSRASSESWPVPSSQREHGNNCMFLMLAQAASPAPVPQITIDSRSLAGSHPATTAFILLGTLLFTLIIASVYKATHRGLSYSQASSSHSSCSACLERRS